RGKDGDRPRAHGAPRHRAADRPHPNRAAARVHVHLAAVADRQHAQPWGLRSWFAGRTRRRAGRGRGRGRGGCGRRGRRRVLGLRRRGFRTVGWRGFGTAGRPGRGVAGELVVQVLRTVTPAGGQQEDRADREDDATGHGDGGQQVRGALAAAVLVLV